MEIRDICLSARIKKAPKRLGKKCFFTSCEQAPPYSRLDIHLKRVHNYISQRSSKPTHKSEEKIFHYLKLYESYCTTLDGNLNSGRMAHQKALKMKQIIIGCQLNDPLLLFSPNLTETLHNWFLDYAKEHSPSSALTYINVLINFASFCFEKQIKKITFEEKSTFIDKLHRWQRSINKLSKGFISHRKPVIDIETVKSFEKSEHVQNIEEMINIYEKYPNTIVTCNKHCLIRNYLFLSTLLVNCCRPCVLTNLTVQEFQTVEMIRRDNNTFYIIAVKDHKTVNDHGPARIALNSKQYKGYMVYNSVFRNFIKTKNNLTTLPKYMFISFTGKEMASSDINKCLKQMWQQSGGKGDIGATLIRSAATTYVHRSKGHIEKELLARLLCHKPETADKFYRQITRGEDVIDAVNLVKDVFSNNDNEDDLFELENNSHDKIPQIEENSVEEQANVEEPIENDTPESQLEYNSDISVLGNSDSDNDDLIHQIKAKKPKILNSALPYWMKEIIKSTGRGRVTFTPEERKAIAVSFLSFIEKEQLPSRKLITEKILINPELNFLKNQLAPKSKIQEKVIGSLKNLIAKKKKIAL